MYLVSINVILLYDSKSRGARLLENESLNIINWFSFSVSVLYIVSNGCEPYKYVSYLSSNLFTLLKLYIPVYVLLK